MDYFTAITGEGIKEILKRNIIVLHGTQEVLMEEIEEKIREKIIDDSYREFDYIRLNAVHIKGEMEEQDKTWGVKDIMAELEAFPFGSKKKMVTVKRCEKLPVEQKKRLADYITGIPSSSVLILMFEGKSNLSTLLGSALEKNTKKIASFINCTLKPNEMIKWVIGKAARANGKNIEAEESKYLINRVGSDLRDITNELKKLSSFTEPDFRIKKEAIDLCCHRQIQSGVFDLVDSVGMGQTYRALRIFADLLKQQEEPLKILATLNNYINLIKQLKEVKEKRIPGQEIVSIFQEIGEHPFRIQKALQNNYFTVKSLKKSQKWILEADISIKTGRQKPETVMEMLIILLCQEAKKKKQYVKKL